MDTNRPDGGIGATNGNRDTDGGDHTQAVGALIGVQWKQVPEGASLGHSDGRHPGLCSCAYS